MPGENPIDFDPRQFDEFTSAIYKRFLVKSGAIVIATNPEILIRLTRSGNAIINTKTFWRLFGTHWPLFDNNPEDLIMYDCGIRVKNFPKKIGE